VKKPGSDLLLGSPGKLIGGVGERRIERLDLSLEVGNEVVFLGELGAKKGGLGFKSGDTCREGNRSDLAGHIELLEWIRGQDLQDILGKIEGGTS
jgi:hypothetical protein